MNKFLIALMASIAFVSTASADVISVARVKLNGGYSVFELHDEPALLPECRDSGAWGVIAKIETPTKSIGYGTGCWVSDNGDYVHILVKSFEDGVSRETTIHKSRFHEPKQIVPTGEAKMVIGQIDALNDRCRGGSGDDPKTMAACGQRDAAMKKATNLGWCWGPVNAIGADKRWIRCD